MSTAPDPFEILVRLGSDSIRGIYLKPGCDDIMIDRLQSEAIKKLGEEIPPAYIRLLKITNGVQINNAYFKEAEHLVPENLDVPRPQIIVLGNEGNVAECVFDRRDRRFHVINMGYLDERHASFRTFEELLLEVMKSEQVI